MAQNSLSASKDREVVIDIEIKGEKEALASVAAAQKALDALIDQRKELKANKKGTEEYYTELAKLNTQINDQKKVLQANQRVLDQQVQAYKKNEDSINEMRARLKLLRAAYEDMSKTERDSAKGDELVNKIKKLSDEIKNLEAKQGDFRSNVGNYQSIWDANVDQMKKFGDVLSSVFGSNSVFGKAATVVQGFSRVMNQVGKDMQSSGTQITDSAKTMGSETTKSYAEVAQSMQQVGTAAKDETVVVQGFGKALYETSEPAKEASESLETASQAATDLAGSTETLENGATAVASSASQIAGGASKLSSGFAMAGQAVKAFSKQMMALMTNPWVALIAAIVAIIVKLVKEFKKNDDAMTALQKTMAAFQPILDVINKLFNLLVGAITKAITAVGNFVTKLLSIVPGFKEASNAAKQYVQDLDDLEEAERQYTVESAKNEAKIADLRDKAADKEHYTAEERIKFNKEAQRLEEENYKKQKALAAERLRLAKIQQKQDNDYSDDRKNEIAQLEADYIKADTDYANAHRSLQKEQQRFQKEIAAEEKELEQERKQRAKEWQQIQKERRENELKAVREYEDALIAAMDEGFAKQLKQIETSGKREIDDLKKKLKEEKNLTSKARDEINKLIEQKQKDLNKKLILSQSDYWNNLRAEIIKAMSSSTSFISTDRLSTDLKKISTELKNTIAAIDENGLKVANDLYSAFSKTFNLAVDSGDSLAKQLKSLIGDDFLNFDNYKSALKSLGTLIMTQTGKTLEEVNKMFENDKWFSQMYKIYNQYLDVVGDQSRQVNNLIIENTQKAASIIQKSIFDAISNGSVTAYTEWISKHEGFARAMADKFGESYLDQMKGIMVNIDTMLEDAYSGIATSTNDALTERLRQYIRDLEEVKQVILSTNNAEKEANEIRRQKAQLIIDERNTEEELAKIQLDEDKAAHTRLLAQAQYLDSIKETVRAREQSYLQIRKETANQREQLEDQKHALQNLIEDMQNQAIKLGVEVDQSAIDQLQQQIVDITNKENELTQQVADAANLLAQTGFASLEEFNAAQDEMVTKVVESNAKIAEDTKKLNNAQIDSWVNTFNTIASAAGQLSNAFGSLFSALAEDNEEMQKYSNAMAYIDIMMSMAQGIATAVAEGMKMGWPAAAIMIPVGIATVVGGIAEAISVYKQNKNVKSSPKFSTGGPVDRSTTGGMVGRHTTTRTDDTVDAKLSLGEYVIRSSVVKALGTEFFDMINGTKVKKPKLPLRFSSGGTVPSVTTIQMAQSQMDYSQMKEVFTEVVQEIQPVVSVQEINTVQNRVNVKEQTASYK